MAEQRRRSDTLVVAVALTVDFPAEEQAIGCEFGVVFSREREQSAASCRAVAGDCRYIQGRLTDCGKSPRQAASRICRPTDEYSDKSLPVADSEFKTVLNPIQSYEGPAVKNPHF